MSLRHWTIIALALFLFSLVVFFSPIVFGRIPFPADALLGMYHPYRDVVWDGLTTGVPLKNFLTTDPVLQTYPWRELAISELREGRLPLWNPYTFSGTPLFANIQAAVLNPFNLLLFVFPFPIGWTILILLQPLLGGLFFFLYTRRLNLHPLAGSFGAIAWVLGGFFLGWMTWGTIGFVALWLPLLLWTIEQMRLRLTWKILLLFFLAFVVQLISGHLQTSFYLSVLVLIYGFFRVHHRRVFFGLMTAAVLVSAIQLLPTLELLSVSARGQDLGPSFLQRGFLPWKHLAMFFAPDFFGNPVTMNYFGEWNYLEFIGYIGIIPLMIAIAGFQWKTFHQKFFVLVIILGLFFALPHVFSQLPQQLHIPFFSTAAPSRLLFLIDFSLTILAAIGLDRFLRMTVKRSIYVVLLSIPAVALIGLWGIAVQFQLSVSMRNLLLPTALAAIAALFSLIGLYSKRLLLPCALVLVVLTAGDMVRFAQKFTPFSPIAWVYPSTKILDQIQSDPDDFRIMSNDRRILPPNTTIPYRIKSIEGYDPIYAASYGRYIASMEQGREEDLSLAFQRIITPKPMKGAKFDALGVKYLLSLSDVDDPQWENVMVEGETRLYRNRSFSGISFRNADAYRRFVEDAYTVKIGALLSILGLIGGGVIIAKNS